jgi:hypothetical protein
LKDGYRFGGWVREFEKATLFDARLEIADLDRGAFGDDWKVSIGDTVTRERMRKKYQQLTLEMLLGEGLVVRNAKRHTRMAGMNPATAFPECASVMPRRRDPVP